MLKTKPSYPPKLVLASNSTARKQLLAQADVTFDVIPAHIDERTIEMRLVENGVDLKSIAAPLAIEKALTVAKKRPGDLIIGADQTLTLDGNPFHKPKDMEAARQQLMALRDKTHVLSSAVALVINDQTIWQYTADISLTMRAFDEEEVDNLLALEGEQILQCVGAYRLDGPMVRLFSQIDGDYFSILGLPLVQLMAGLRQHAPNLLEPHL